MTKGQLFREVWLELHPDCNDEDMFNYADTIVPDYVKQEIPPDQLESLRKEFLALGRIIDAQPMDVNREHLSKFLGKN